jgi:membrane-anchored protein YejM (alkaline phosphatase superfamily)
MLSLLIDEKRALESITNATLEKRRELFRSETFIGFQFHLSIFFRVLMLTHAKSEIIQCQVRKRVRSMTILLLINVSFATLSVEWII